jgi:pimeloyl-ACP methyl ester carboxylesterase
MAMALPYSWSGASEGPIVAFSNSLGTTRAMWDPVLPWVEGAFRVLRYELPGHFGPSGPFTFRDMVDGTIDVLERAEAGGALVVGVSVGGAIGVAVGAERPDLVSGVIAVNAPVRQSSKQFWFDRAESVERDGLGGIAAGLWDRWFPERTPEALAVVADFERLDPAGYAAACRALADLDIADDAARLEVPALVVSAVDDASVPPGNSSELAATIRDSILWPVTNAGHLLPVRRPAILGSLIRAFADSRAA